MEDTHKSFNELMDTPLDFSVFMMNRLKVDTLNHELLASPTFELMKESCKSLVELEYFFEEVYKETTDQLDWNNPEDVYSKRKIITVTKLQIVEWHNYKHLDWITVRRDDDKLYKFKEGDFNRLRIQDIEDMLLLLVQGKLRNLTVEERLAFNNKDKKNRLIRIDELHNFSDDTLNDVQTALNDRLKGIRMNHGPSDAMHNPPQPLKFDESDTHVLERFDTSAGNPVKEILLKLNIPDHRILKDGGEGT
ncbi:hypothetical protein Tco_0120764 [Tanacetum coccineum]